MTPLPDPVIVNILINCDGKVIAASNCPGVEIKVTRSERIFAEEFCPGLPHSPEVIRP